VEPFVPLTEIDDLIFDSLRTVLVEHLIDGSGKPFGVCVGKFVIVVEKNSRVIVLVVQWFELLRVVRQQDFSRLPTPRD
jgi:hypothetical protein